MPPGVARRAWPPGQSAKGPYDGTRFVFTFSSGSPAAFFAMRRAREATHAQISHKTSCAPSSHVLLAPETAILGCGHRRIVRGETRANGTKHLDDLHPVPDAAGAELTMAMTMITRSWAVP